MPDHSHTIDRAATPLSVADLSTGQQGLIHSVDIGSRQTARFACMGIRRGAMVEVEGKALLGSPIRIRIGERYLAIRKQDAQQIHVQLQ